MTPPIDPYADDDDVLDDPFASPDIEDEPEAHGDVYDPYSDADPIAYSSHPKTDSEPPAGDTAANTPEREPELLTESAIKPRIIAADVAEEEDGWEYDDADFGDITPQQTRFTAPAAEDVFTAAPRSADESPEAEDNQTASRSDKKAAAKAEKLARKQQAAAQREQRKADRREEKLRKAETKAATGKSSDLEDGQKKSAAGKVLAGLGVAVVAAIGVAFASDSLFAGSGQADESTDALAATSAQTAQPEQSTGAQVPATAADTLTQVVSDRCQPKTGELTVTNADGDGSTGESAIEGFNYAYYTLSDAKAATQFLDKKMYDSVDGLQKGIDDPQNGDAYCLEISKGKKPNEFKMGLVEFVEPKEAGGDVVSWRTNQTVATEKHGGKWVIVSVVNETKA